MYSKSNLLPPPSPPASVAVAVAAAAIAAVAADPAAAAVSSATAAALAVATAADPWFVDTKGNVRMPAVQKMMKRQSGKPVVENILCAGSMQAQAAVLHAVVDHPSLAPARKLARIDLSKMQAAYKFVCKQSSCLMKTNCNRANQCARTTDKKRNAIEVMLTFSAPLPEKETGVPSQCDCACVLGMPCSTLSMREKAITISAGSCLPARWAFSGHLPNARRGTPKSMRQFGRCWLRPSVTTPTSLCLQTQGTHYN